MTSHARTRASSAVVLLATFAIVAPVSTSPATAISQLDSIPVGDQPASIVINAAGTRAYVADGADGTVDVIDLASQTVVTTIDVGFGDTDLAFRPGTTELWVTHRSSNSVSIISTATNAVTSSPSFPGGPVGVAFSANGATAFITGSTSDELMEVNATTRTVIDTYPVGEGPVGVAVDHERGQVIVPGSDTNTVTIINPALDTTSTVTVGNGATDIIVDASRDRAIVSDRLDNTLTIVDLTTNTVVDSILIDSQPNGLAPLFDQRLLFVATFDNVHVVDLDQDRRLGNWGTLSATTDVAVTPNGRAVYSTSWGSDAIQVAKFEVDRFGGATRYETAIQMSQEAYPDPHPIVFIASGTSFPDALSLAPAVSLQNGPLLLNPQNSLRADVLAEVNRLDPTTIYLAGGEGVLSNTVRTQLEATGATVVRLSGLDRYATSRAVVTEFFDNAGGYSDLYLVTGRNFPDALSAGAAAGSGGMPMLLVDGDAATLPTATLSLMNTLQPDRVILVGGTGVMSTSIQNQLTGLGGIEVVRAAGVDRYATSVAVTELGFDLLLPSAAYWATGMDYPDALAGITLAAKDSAPIYLVRPTCATDGAIHGAWRHNADRIGILGGTGVVSAAVENFTRC
ncbi:cell wall-binding repeat-containing protein [Microcella sp.]|uniref:cell wall-binding repeat-containing protein n=1 Tax=Microcella sp. TaxID=1913979 RepID=UPI002569A196|nr:cell wall-binding repeat-containing protein [Microcella sp.]MBX9472596.1 cell wall-binding repeat-containing protein [Microcella sp.]